MGKTVNGAPLPEIDRATAWISDESFSERVFRDIYIGTAERHFYNDPARKLSVSVYYNSRIPGKLEFDGKWRLFVTEDSLCRTIFRQHGNLSDESQVYEKYYGLEEAEGSAFYNDFAELIKKAEDSIAWTKDHAWKPYEKYSGSIRFRPVPGEDPEYTVYEQCIPEREEIVQFYWNETDSRWDTMAVSKEPLHEVMNHLKDFEELDRNELHLRRFLPIQEYAMEEGSVYHKEFKSAEDINNWYREPHDYTGNLEDFVKVLSARQKKEGNSEHE